MSETETTGATDTGSADNGSSVPDVPSNNSVQSIKDSALKTLTAYQKRPERNNPDRSLVVVLVVLCADCRNAVAHKSGGVVVLCVSNSRSACERQASRSLQTAASSSRSSSAIPFSPAISASSVATRTAPRFTEALRRRSIGNTWRSPAGST